MDLSLLELKDVLGDIKNLGEGGIDYLNFKNISIDSRTLLKNDLFIAIKGKNFDGHSFLPEVLTCLQLQNKPLHLFQFVSVVFFV